MSQSGEREPTSPVELLACVARADGEVTIEEALAIRGFMAYAGVSQQVARRVERLLDTSHSCDVEGVVRSLARRASPWILTETVRDAYVIASVDGVVEASEIHAVDRLFDMLGIAGNRRAWLHKWGREAAAKQLRGMKFMAASLAEANADLPCPTVEPAETEPAASPPEPEHPEARAEAAVPPDDDTRAETEAPPDHDARAETEAPPDDDARAETEVPT